VATPSFVNLLSDVSALFINDLVAAIALSVCHKTIALSLYNMHIIITYTTISNIGALKYLELLLRL